MKNTFLIIIVFTLFSCLNDKNSPSAIESIITDTTNKNTPPIISVNCSPDTVYFQ